jgi:hypothetical protein
MSVYRKVFIGLICVAFLGMGTGAMVIAGDAMKITGTVNDEGQLVEDSGQVYEINEDEVGAEAMEYSGEKIAVEGMVEEEGGINVIVIKSFKLIQ